MCGINYLSMDEVKARLKMKTTDAAARWCLANNVSILKIGKKNVVVEYEFKLVHELPIITRLQTIYGDRWQKYYAAYNSEDVVSYYTLAKVEERHEPQVEAFNANNFLKHINYGKS